MMSHGKDQKPPFLTRQAQHEFLDDPVAAGVGEDHRESGGTDQDGEDHGGDFDSLQGALPDHADRETAIEGCQQNRTNTTNGG